jgi:hypothetical protein
LSKEAEAHFGKMTQAALEFARGSFATCSEEHNWYEHFQLLMRHPVINAGEGSAKAKDLRLRYSVVPQGTVVKEFEFEKEPAAAIPPSLSVQLESPILKSTIHPSEAVQTMVVGEIAYSEQGVNSSPRRSVQFILDIPGGKTPVQPGVEPTPKTDPNQGTRIALN